jgi:flagellar hook-associated protein 2
MAIASVSGLASGLDTATIIDQLMQVEAAGQTRLKSRVTLEQSTLKLLQNLNAKVAALATQAKDLTKATAWTPLTATSSSDKVTLATTSGTSAGSLSFTVDATALAHKLTFASTAAMTDVVVPLDAAGKRTVTLTVAGTPTTIDTGDGTLKSLVGALNGGGTGAAAAALKLDDGSYRLSVQSTKTGAVNTVTLTAADGTDLLGGATVTAGRDAAITIAGDTLHSATNPFENVLPGLSVTVSTAAIGTTVEVEVSRDTDGAVKQAKALVDAVNSILADISTQTKYNAATKTSGGLAGEAAVRDAGTRLLNAVYPGDGTTLADIGIQTDRYGKLVLDETKFSEAYAADAASVAEKLSGATGLAGRIETVATGISDKYTGTLTASITGRTAGIERLNDSIAAWDTRLELRRTSLTRQFAALETALSQMNSQSSWLSGQINSLNSSSDS